MHIKSTLICILVLLTFSSGLFAKTTTHKLSNGMELVLRENHSSPMVASIIFVESGSKYESRFENGITHFLEHLLFDGTNHKSRLELDQGIRNLGGYINAFTRKDLTAYLVLMPKQHINYGLTTQADMLFNTVFPEQELVKERKVVIEEIKQGIDRPNYEANAFFVEKAMEGTDYNKPVLGYQEFIENIPREAIVDYWKRYYRPGNMTALIIGDFDTDHMIADIEKIFGSITFIDSSTTDSIPADSLQPQTVPSVTYYDPALLDGQAPIQQQFVEYCDAEDIQIDISIFAPPINDTVEYPAVDLLTRYLAMDGVSPLEKALLKGETPLATEFFISLIPYEGFSRIEIGARTENPDNVEAIYSVVEQTFGNIEDLSLNEEILDGIKTEIVCSEIYNTEKLHYYGFLIASYAMTAGWDFIDNYGEIMSKVSTSQIKQTAHKWFSPPAYIATSMQPVKASDQVAYKPSGMAADDVIAHFDSAQIPSYDLSVGFPLEYPSVDSARFAIEDNADYLTEVMDNGLTLIIKSSSDSRVFGMTVLGKNRTMLEPEGKEGITDFVNRCLEKGTFTRPEQQLSKDLASIGANVTLYDNPWIPYDDRYTSRRFSFAKFETIDQYAERGFHLFVEMLMSPSFDSTAIESVRKSMLGIIGRSASSPRKNARNNFITTLLGDQNFARPISGTMASISSITQDDLRDHHKMFYGTGNLILSIATNHPVNKVKEWVERSLGRLTGELVITEPKKPLPQLIEVQKSHVELKSDQIAIYLGSKLPGIDDPDVAPIRMATSILSVRLFNNLREKQGLAYSVGASGTIDRDIGWTYCSIATGSENYDKAIDGMILEIEKLKLDGPTSEELTTAKNQILGRMSSTRLSRVNQAYYMAVNAYLGLGLQHNNSYLMAVSQVSSDNIRRAMSRWFRTDAYVLSTAGTRQ